MVRRRVGCGVGRLVVDVAVGLAAALAEMRAGWLWYRLGHVLTHSLCALG